MAKKIERERLQYLLFYFFFSIFFPSSAFFREKETFLKVLLVLTVYDAKWKSYFWELAITVLGLISVPIAYVFLTLGYKPCINYIPPLAEDGALLEDRLIRSKSVHIYMKCYNNLSFMCFCSHLYQDRIWHAADVMETVSYKNMWRVMTVKWNARLSSTSPLRHIDQRWIQWNALFFIMAL